MLVGVPYGLQRNDAIAFTGSNPNWSLVLNNAYRLQNSQLNLLTYADVLLAKAEARQLGWLTSGPTAQELYKEGIKASWEQWGVFDQDKYDAYLLKTSIAFTAGSELERIGTQRWLAFFPNGNQGWSEWRRTGFPALSPSPSPVNTSKQIPTRFIYPTGEYNLNGTNLQEAVAKIAGGDTMDGKVWWDK